MDTFRLIPLKVIDLKEIRVVETDQEAVFVVHRVRMMEYLQDDLWLLSTLFVDVDPSLFEPKVRN
jgi:hypothetical protein